MNRYRVEFSHFALRHLDELWNYVTDRNSAQVANGLIQHIVTYCSELADFPDRGRARDDIHPGLRVCGYRRRATIAFVVTGSVIEIHGVFWGGRDFENLLRVQLPRDH